MLLDELIEERESSTTAYAEFLYAFKNENQYIYFFAEGEEDIPYYQNRISLSIPGGFSFNIFCCNGKEQVLAVFNRVSSMQEYHNTRFGFFVDRDFDPPINNPAIYETPYHSIENFFTDSDTIGRILRTLFHIDERSADFYQCMQVYSNLFDEFHAYTLPINVWINCYIDKRNYDTILQPVNVNQRTEHLFDQVVNRQLDTIVRDHHINNLDELQGYFANIVDVTEAAYESKRQHFLTLDLAHHMRGKFEIAFLAKFLHCLKHRIERRHNGLVQNRYTTDHIFNKETIMVLLGTFAYTPECLRAYIQQIAA